MRGKTIGGYLKTKKLEITIETYERLMIKQPGKQVIICAECGETVEALKPEVAAKVLGIAVRLIYQWVEAGRLHFREYPDGSLLICHQSLQKLF